jgi:CRP-like cAMP-binding protein
MEVFEYLTEDERRLLLEHARGETYQPGDAIVEEGTEPQAIFIVRSGTASVEKLYLGEPVPVGELEAGAIFGEMSFLEGTVTGASVTALDQVEVDVIEGKALSQLLSVNPTLAAHFYQSLAATLAQRLRRMNAEAVVGAFSWG